MTGKTDQIFTELYWVSQGSRGQDKLRVGTIEVTYLSQSPYQICNVRSKDTSVLMCFVNDYEFQILQELAPFIVPWEDLVNFVGIGYDNP